MFENENSNYFGFCKLLQGDNVVVLCFLMICAPTTLGIDKIVGGNLSLQSEFMFFTLANNI